MTTVKNHQRLGAVIISVLMAVVLLLGSLGYSSQASASSGGVFTPRTTAPTRSNPYYYSSMNAFYACGYGMPNCTAYAWGRAYEILGTRPKLCTSSAQKWWNYNINGGYYPHGKTPKLGAIACWTRGGSGHVAVVEAISGNQVTISESHRYHGNFDTKTLTIGRESGYAGSFQGYIYILDSAMANVTYKDLVKKDGYATGNYTVDTSGYSLRVRIAASNNAAEVTTIPDKTEIYVEEVSGDWGKVGYDNKTGWIYLPYCGNFRGLAKVKDNWYYFDNNKVDPEANTIVKNHNGWFYVEGGKVDLTFHGIAKNENGKWYLKKGKVNFDFTGLYKDNYVKEGRVQEQANGLTSIDGKWYYLKDGKVDKDYNGLAKNNLGTWVVQDGKVSLDFTGLYTADGVTYNVINSKVLKEANK